MFLLGSARDPHPLPPLPCAGEGVPPQRRGGGAAGNQSLKNRRDIFIIVGLFLALILFVALGPGRQPPPSDPETATTHSSADGGALALYNWARAMGYDARRLEYRPFTLEEDDGALVILNPSEAINRAQAR